MSLTIQEDAAKVDLTIQERAGVRPLRVAALRPLYEAAVTARNELRFMLAEDKRGHLDHVVIRDVLAALEAAIDVAEAKGGATVGC